MAEAHEFLTPAALGNFATATTAVIAVSRVVRYLCHSDQPAITFMVALVVAYLTAGAAGTLTAVPWQDLPRASFFSAAVAWFLPVMNACLLFMAALGASRML
jgi:hypothetical protein